MRALRDSVVAIVGLGLMGGSLALALRAKNACKRILAITRNPEARERAVARGIVDEASTDLALMSNADVIVLATPVRTIIEQLPHVGSIVRAGAVILDMGSTKRDIVRAMENLPAHVQAIGAHPMCGKETFGFDAADTDLYRNAAFVLTPLARTSAETLAFAKSLAETLNARPIVLDAARHDKIVAAVSHLPFALASTLVTTAAELANGDDLFFTLAASGFRDTSRLAASDTTMMLDILLTNCENVIEMLRAYSRQLDTLTDLIADQDETALRAVLERAATKRREMFK